MTALSLTEVDQNYANSVAFYFLREGPVAPLRPVLK